ncbi:carbohydrate kinase [Stenotrophomonas pictorum JCM 9942]|uniref:Bifunctional NAD(P)H-hydrate repair enzyme n=1 Tax=Stenotrophomonas pictorum JCM 9942 TaxID=1236960 RepID=A0A0R0ACP2_9GAMM|nr:NAD(P)H-hydrate dehydratase [Stenotrophomonas pictorum]KRG42678.1 carbohydrate kinase [Stenotrophomonas pictorum JCM 9942]
MDEPVELFDTVAAGRIDVQATALLGGDGYVLMQRAGQAAWQCVLQHWPQARRLVVVCGPGNNGGDGYVLARLARQSGREVSVLHPRGAAPRSALAQRACTDYLAIGGHVEVSPDCLRQAELIVDALYGIGFSRAPEAADAALIAAINAAGVPVLALDVPSGVDADSGKVPGEAVRAGRVLQFIVAHRGLYTGTALEFAGQRLLADLDLPPPALDGIAASVQRWSKPALSQYLPRRRLNTHKGESGHVLCVGGNHGAGGAVMLAAEAALRSGAGLTSVATRGVHVAPLLARCPEAMAHGIENIAGLDALLARASVVALGPGLGQDAWAQALYAAVLASGKRLVVDADALNLLALEPRPLPQAVLTPHPGEAARLLGTDTASVQQDRFAAAQALAGRYSAVVVLKGAGTVVASPGQLPRVIAAGNPGMAVGGMGDLLTGVIAALCAQGLALFDAASTGALLHALAGDVAALDGERGLLPRDLLPHLRALANP